MSKCVLVMDMPKNCQGCKLKSRVHGIQNVAHCCNLAEEMITLDKGFEERLPNCPLRELPVKKEDNANNSESFACFKLGYNACIDELLKGEEG